MSKRTIVETETGPVLIQQIEGTRMEVIGAISEAEIEPTDSEWADMHKKLKTGKLDFVTVKKEHEVSRKRN
jgi:hypothetical protein